MIALGANLPSGAGSPAQTLIAAIAAMAEAGTTVKAVSRFFATPAFPPGNGPDYVNAAIVVGHSAEPGEMLQILHGIEARLGRVRGTRWASRAVDLDLLGADDLVLPDAATLAHWMALPPEAQTVETPDRLILPHPRLHQRGFVLLPLADVAPDWRHPALGRTVRQLVAALPAESREGIAVL